MSGRDRTASNAGSVVARPERWFGSPVLWLGVMILAAVIAACVATVLLAVDQDDAALPVHGEQLLNVPAAHTGAAPRRSSP